ncbi:hypothetical protein [Aureispira sp. CCB-QB1]|uniref:hypothetical protein n=1 Tax=Aureispira sp. CCB-QB1 TaxID=1313421 RepID=UPI0006991B56|nr:hypothetical protein [Aureispira sp. CCB-QB1]
MELKEQINQLHNTASDLKRRALLDQDIDLFRQAANKFRELSNLFGDLIENHPDKIKFGETVHYQFAYSYQCKECLYAYYFRAGKNEEAIEHAEEAKNICEKWLNEISNKLKKEPNISQEEIKKIELNEKYWHYSLKTIEIKTIEPLVTIKENEGKFIEAWDLRKKMLRIHKGALQYAKDESLKESFIRTSEGNFYGLLTNISQGTLKILDDKIKRKRVIHNINSLLLKHLVESYENANKAFEANPEQDIYSLTANNLYQEIQTLLNKKHTDWYKLTITFQEDSKVLTIMEKINPKKFNDIKSQRAAFEKNIAIGSGLGTLITVAAFSIFFPCPSEFQYIIFRILIAVGVAAFSVTIAGTLSIENNGIKATGGLGVLVFVYLLNPASIVIRDDCSQHETKIEGIITINGKLKNSIQISNLESEISRSTNSLGKFEMSIPENELKGDELTFQIKTETIDTIIKVVPSTTNLQKLKIDL